MALSKTAGPNVLVRTVLMIVGVLLLVGALAYGGYRLVKERKDTGSSDSQFVPVEQEGELKTPDERNSENSKIQQELEQKIAEGVATHEDYLALAEQANWRNQKEKALEYYEAAREVLPDGVHDHDNIAKWIEDMIASLQEEVES